jgi:outer membrane biosynthesis protein TonB
MPMKQLLRPQTVIVGTAVLALLGWTTASAATGSFGDRHAGSHSAALHVEQAIETPEASPSAEPEVKNEAPEPSPEPAETPEAQPNEIEAAEPAENENNDEHQAPVPAPAPAPTSSSRTFQLVGGTATFTCTGNAISLDSAVPAAGFSVETESEDGSQQIRVRFESDSHRSEIQAACSGGQVMATEIREESD